jgi:hypothetical protein
VSKTVDRRNDKIKSDNYGVVVVVVKDIQVVKEIKFASISPLTRL